MNNQRAIILIFKINHFGIQLKIKPFCYPDGVLEGCLITKNKRHEIFGCVAGGAGSQKPEKFQRKKIIEGTRIPCITTKMRIHFRSNTLKEISFPNTKKDGFDYSENFDGYQFINNKHIYINLKCIVGKGGTQTRSLREVYWFIEGQLNIIKNINNNNIYFVNILDGDEAYYVMNKFDYLLQLEHSKIKEYIYIGDLREYFVWFKKLFYVE